MLQILKTDFDFKDERGSFTQLVHEGYRQINVIFSKKGVVRGGHYHKLNQEAFFVINGSLEVTVNQEKFVFSSGDFFAIEAMDMHSFKFLEDSVLVSMYSVGVELPDGGKDIYV